MSQNLLIDESKSAEILENILKQSGLEYRKVQSGEEGGFFYIDEHGVRQKFTENIFIKRSIKEEMQKQI